MTVRWDTTQVDGNPMRIYIGIPDSPGPHPAVLVAQHAGGVDAPIQDVVNRLHREGYVAAAPDLFHRQPAGLEQLQRTALLKDAEILADLNAAIAHLKTLKLTAAPIGITGYCMGGRVAYLGATSIPRIKAAAVFYGGNIMKALGDGPSPFERSADINCPVIGFFGAEDTNPSPADTKKISEELTRLGKWHEFHTYNNTGHAFHNFLTERYRERAARSSWHGMLAFFTECLKRTPA